ncbi:MAG: P-loop NTPase, partial [Nitratireductor sp.]|nr:P-loop NTPase [Nitratireductor sp.]
MQLTATKETVLAQLRKVKGPDKTGNIVDLGLVSDIFVADRKVYFSITVPSERAQELEPLRAAAERVATSVDGIDKAVVALTAAKKPGASQAGSQPTVRPAPSAAQAGSVLPPMQRAAPQPPSKADVPGIGAIIAVASGKGGVGKSTTSVNLALALQANGLRVGVLDADIYGPSMPRLLRISGRPKVASGRVLKPMEGYGLKVMSMGFLVDEETPMIWRGPM